MPGSPPAPLTLQTLTPGHGLIGGVLGQKALPNSIPVSLAGDLSGHYPGSFDDTGKLIVTVGAGEIRQEPFLPILAPVDGYKPESLSELVRGTPRDIIQTVTEDLSGMAGGGVKSILGKTIEPLPKELSWIETTRLESDILYTFIRQVVHQELEQFAQRIEQFFVLTPKE